MIEIIAEATNGSGPMIPGEWLTGFVVAVIGAVAALMARKSGVKEGAEQERTQNRTITNNPLETKEVPDWATREDIDQLRAEIKELAAKVERNFETERETARGAIGNIHKRIDAQSITASTLMGKLDGLSENVKMLLDLALKGAKKS